MRIGIFSESFRPLVNGVSYSVQSFARTLTAMGHEVHVFAAHYPGYEDPPDYPVYRYPGILTTIEQGYNIAVPFWPPMIAIMRRLRLDVIHTQSPFLLGVAGARWARWLGVPLVTTLHTLYTEYVHYAAPLPPVLARMGVMKWVRHYCNRADHVIVPTEPIRAVARDYGITRPVSVVATGIDFEAIRAADPVGIREEHGIGRDAELIVFVGRLTREKNAEMLVDAFSLIAAARPRAHLMLVGGGPEEEALHRRVAEADLADRVTFAGWRSPEERNRRLRAGDLFLYPSVTDTQGLVLCEALAAGLPCVAADAFGAKAVIRPRVDGLLAEPNPAELAGKAVAILAVPDRRREMSQAAAVGSVRFSEQAAAESLLAIYREVVAQPPRPRSRLLHSLAGLRHVEAPSGTEGHDDDRGLGASDRPDARIELP